MRPCGTRNNKQTIVWRNIDKNGAFLVVDIFFHIFSNFPQHLHLKFFVAEILSTCAVNKSAVWHFLCRLDSPNRARNLTMLWILTGTTSWWNCISFTHSVCTTST
jgi:hypothetical protein